MILTAFSLSVQMKDSYRIILPPPSYSFSNAEVEFEKVVFLYHLEQGQASASYGLNVASLAGLPNSILLSAHRKSKSLEREVLGKVSCKALSSKVGFLLTTLTEWECSSAPAPFTQTLRDAVDVISE